MRVAASPWKLSRVTPWSHNRLLQWFGLGPKVWPIPLEKLRAWRRAIYTFWREQLAFEPAEAQRWFRKAGWSKRQATAILAQIQQDLEALDDYAQMLEADREDPA